MITPGAILIQLTPAQQPLCLIFRRGGSKGGKTKTKWTHLDLFVQVNGALERVNGVPHQLDSDITSERFRVFVDIVVVVVVSR